MSCDAFFEDRLRPVFFLGDAIGCGCPPSMLGRLTTVEVHGTWIPDQVRDDDRIPIAGLPTPNPQGCAA